MERAPLPDFSFTSLCPDLFETGCCSRGMNCKFAHSPSELKQRAYGTDDVFELQMVQGVIGKFKTQIWPSQQK